MLLRRIILGGTLSCQALLTLRKKKKFWQALFKKLKIRHFYFGNNTAFLFWLDNTIEKH
jgi:hypothetical protein